MSDDVVAAFDDMISFDGTGTGQGLDHKEINIGSGLSGISEIGGGSGLSDFSVSIFGFELVIPFSDLNRFIEMFGYAMMAIAWIRAYQIIAGIM